MNLTRVPFGSTHSIPTARWWKNWRRLYCWNLTQQNANFFVVSSTSNFIHLSTLTSKHHGYDCLTFSKQPPTNRCNSCLDSKSKVTAETHPIRFRKLQVFEHRTNWLESRCKCVCAEYERIGWLLFSTYHHTQPILRLLVCVAHSVFLMCRSACVRLATHMHIRCRAYVVWVLLAPRSSRASLLNAY